MLNNLFNRRSVPVVSGAVQALLQGLPQIHPFPETDQMGLVEGTRELALGLATPREQTFAVVGWISRNFTPDVPPGAPNDVYGWFATRTGGCGARSLLAVAMLDTLGIPARCIGFYDYSAATPGHVCVEAYYEGGWHLFDTMFGGFFLKDDGVLSWDEVMEAPLQAIRCIVPFPDGVYSREANDQTMHNVYTEDNLRAFRSYGVQNRDTVVVVYNQVDLSALPFSFGEENSSYDDLSIQGGQAPNLSAFTHLGLSAGGAYDINVQTEWEFINCIPGRTYYIEYHLYSANNYGTPFYALGKGAAIAQGAHYQTSPELVEQQPESWRIEFVPSGETCSVRIAYDFTDYYIGADIDFIVIGPA